LELALNFAWFAISIAVFVFFGRQLVSKSGTKGGKKNVGLTWIALVCVVCLVFPAVSMTDDLISNPAMPEATKCKSLFALTQVVIHLFSRVPISQPRGLKSATLVFEQKQKPPFQECVSFNLSRRPPPPSFLPVQAFIL